MEENTYGVVFRFVQKNVRLLLPRYRFERPPILGKPVVYVSYLQSMVGPISILAWVKYYIRLGYWPNLQIEKQLITTI